MSRVEVTFDGRSRGAVSAARETAAGIAQVRREARTAEQDLGKLARGAVAGSGALSGLGRSVAFASAGFLGGYGLTAAIAGAVREMSDSIRVTAQTNAALRSTGAVAGVTARQVDAMAQALMRKSGTDDEAIKSAENLLLTFTQVRNEAGKGNDIFNQATRSVLDMSIAMGTDLSSAAIQVGKALNDPVRGFTALQRVGVTFTEQQRQQIKTLTEHGRVLDAQRIILRELNREFGGSAAAYGQTFPGAVSRAREAIRNMSADIAREFTPELRSGVAWLQRQVDALERSRKAHEDVRRVARDVAAALSGGVAIVKTAARAFDTLSDAVGGDKHALELLGGAVGVWKAAGAVSLVASFGGIKTAAEEAATAVGTTEAAAGGGAAAGGLAGRLAALRTIGAIAIPIVITFELAKNQDKIHSWLQQHVPGLGWLNAFAGKTRLVPGGKTDFGGSDFAGGGTRGGGGGGDFPTSQGSKIVSAARAEIGIPYFWGGGNAAGPTWGGHAGGVHGMGFDCSGLAVYALNQAGIKVPRTTAEGLFHLGRQVVGPLQPGDLVFFEGPHPGHVGVYIGNGQVIHAPHTGASVETSSLDGLSKALGYSGARRYTKEGKSPPSTPQYTPHDPRDFITQKKKPAADTGLLPLGIQEALAAAQPPLGTTAEYKAALQEAIAWLRAQLARHPGIRKRVQLDDALAQYLSDLVGLAPKKKTPTSPGTPTGEGLIPAAIRVALGRDVGTRTTSDDLRDLLKARDALIALQKTAAKRERVPIAEELGRINSEINQIRDDKAKAKLAAIQAAYERTSERVKATIDAQREAWDRNVQHLQQVADTARQAFETAFGKGSDETLREFDQAVDQRLKAMQTAAAAALKNLQVMVSGNGFASFLFGGGVTQTPAEGQLATLQAQRAVDERAKSLADARQRLADAQTGYNALFGLGTSDVHTADPADVARAEQEIRDAQQSIDDAQFNERLAGLEDQARVERDAADQQLQQAQDAYEAQAQAEQDAYSEQQRIARDGLQGWLDEQRQKLEDGKLQWDTFFSDLKGKAAAGGFTIGDAFWTSWEAAAAAHAGDLSAGAAVVAQGTEFGAGSPASTLQAARDAIATAADPAAAYAAYVYLAQGRKLEGFAGGGFVGSGSYTIDPRDSILIRARRGEYVMSPEEVAAGAPRWASRGGSGGDVYNVTVLGGSSRQVERALGAIVAQRWNSGSVRGGYRIPGW